MTAPLIGISTENTRIAAAIRAHGATPVTLCQELMQVPGYIAGLQGVVIPGNPYDIPPALYGEEQTADTVIAPDTTRLSFESALLRAALANNTPILAICGGTQLLNVVAGGSLIQHLSEGEGALNHRQNRDELHKPEHTVSLLEGTYLRSIAGSSSAYVNSDHHQAIRTLGKGLRASAFAEDGVIEAIEHTGHSFAIGVQWHPEYLVDTVDHLLFAALVSASVEFNPLLAAA